MRFVLHLLATLLLVEEDAGRHEDGTADGERLADESRAVAGLGEVAGLGGIRAGEVLRGVCRLLLCDLLCLLSCDLIGKLLLRCDTVGLRQLVGGECRIVAGLELVHRGLLLVQDGLGGRDLGTCLDCCGEKRVEGVIRVRVMAGSDRRAGIDGVQLRQLGVCLRLCLFGSGDQGLGGAGGCLRGIERGLGVIDGPYCILLALLCLCELRGKTGEDVEVRLCVLEIGLGAGKLVGGNAGVGLCGIDGTLASARARAVSSAFCLAVARTVAFSAWSATAASWALFAVSTAFLASATSWKNFARSAFASMTSCCLASVSALAESSLDCAVVTAALAASKATCFCWTVDFAVTTAALAASRFDFAASNPARASVTPCCLDARSAFAASTARWHR